MFNQISTGPLASSFNKYIFLSFQEEDFEKVSKHSTSKYGPQVVTTNSQFFIRSRRGIEVIATPLSAVTAMKTILAVYYLLNLTYPACFGQTLCFLQGNQETILSEQFALKSKKTQNFNQNSEVGKVNSFL